MERPVSRPKRADMVRTNDRIDHIETQRVTILPVMIHGQQNQGPVVDIGITQTANSSEQNRSRVARGYGLTKDMSSASAAVRESVQETSKSAKRQGELIQPVNNAAEYIQALNTKISVVAINTRIEAEKADEYGRPFLGRHKVILGRCM